MEWYCSHGTDRVGPLSEQEFEALVNQGTVRGSTLVWREGMADWQPYEQVVAAASAVSAAPAGAPIVAPAVEAGFCSQCGRRHFREDLISYDGLLVCAECKPRFFQEIAEGLTIPPIQQQLRYAGFWIRLVAARIDGIILTIVEMPFSLVFQRLIIAADNSTQAVVMSSINWVLSMAMQAAYYTFFVGKLGATPGKLAIGLKIVVADGSRVSYWRAFGRHWARILSGLILLIGYIMAGFDSQKRALHDYICNTRVIWRR